MVGVSQKQDWVSLWIKWFSPEPNLRREGDFPWKLRQGKEAAEDLPPTAGMGGRSLPCSPLVSALWAAATHPNLVYLVSSSELNTEVTKQPPDQISPAIACEGHIPKEMMDQMLLGNE